MNFKKTAGKGNGSSSRSSSTTTFERPPVAGTAGTTTQSSKAPVRTSAMEAKPQQREITPQAIAEAAYFLWKKRGGSDLSNWLEAEAALRSTSKR